jgi:serine/threonine protein kinase
MEGEQLPDGWVVEKKIAPKPGVSTGGNFSVGYTARHPDKGEGFLKALDWSRAMNQPGSDPTVVVQHETAAFNHEVSVLEKCGSASLNRVIVALDWGTHRLPGQSIPVPYLVFEKAQGDVRRHLDAAAAFDTAWALRMLHQVAVGLSQMHGVRIVHQDMKPSNVLMIEENESKVGDVGRSEYDGHMSPYSGLGLAGDRNYAPPELLYGHYPADWNERRACDLYHCGSLILFFFADANATPALLSKLDKQYWPGACDYQTALPFVRQAMNEVANDLGTQLKGESKDGLVTAFRELCDPEPEHRGHPKASSGEHGDPYSFERYISRFNLLADRAEMGLVEALRQ